MGKIEDRWRLGMSRREALTSLAGVLAASPLLKAQLDPHSLIGHKEDRFLVPMTWAVVPLLILAADRIASEGPGFLTRWMASRAGRAGARAFVVVNLAILAVTAVKSSHETEVVFRWLWRAAEKEPITVYHHERVAVHFPRPRDLFLSTAGPYGAPLRDARRTAWPSPSSSPPGRST